MSYAVDKLAAHPEVLHRLRTADMGRLITVHLMPQNTCNQGCSFCAYRLADNKNSSDFDESKSIPPEALSRLLADLAETGVQGIEVTGGGEPLAYPHTEQLWAELASHGFATALVTNGTLLKDRVGLILASRLKWVRVSIDCASPVTYANMRRAPHSHFNRAWAAVEEFRLHAPKDPDFRLGVGFVACNENLDEVYEFVRMARDFGADNVRLSVTFSDQGEDFFNDKLALERAVEDSQRAVADFSSPSFRVHNLMPKRQWEVQHPTQDYRRCPTKDVLCVVEGECKVYTCCTFTGSVYGCYGKFTDHDGGFRGLWSDYMIWRKHFRADEYCNCACLYRDRNLAMNELIDGPALITQPSKLHKEFI